MYLRLASADIDLSRPQVMGILNVTPDSFSDGGQFVDLQSAVTQAANMVEDGVAIIDIGGESSRPGSVEISLQAEIDRVVPVVEAVCQQLPVPVSIDTSKPAVMAAAAAAGASMINDVYALRRDGALQTVADLGLAVCLMHMQGEPASMQDAPHYDDVIGAVTDFLAERANLCRSAGIPADKICIDPGFGFGKTDADNLLLLRKLQTLQRLELPILVGLSRKRTLGTVTGKSVHKRLAAGVAAATFAVLQGANLVRTHDVAATVDALRMIHAIREHE